MFANNLKIAIRNLRKHKVFSLINILGLGIGMAASFIILQFVVYELSYDRFHKKGERIFQIQSYNPAEGNESIYPYFESELAPHLKATDPAIVNYVRIFGKEEMTIKNPDKPGLTEKKQNILFADTSFFSVFTFPLIKGNATTVLSRPGTVVISEKVAELYFGDQDPVGRKLIYKGDDLFYFEENKDKKGKHRKSEEPSVKGQTELLEVSGVMENMPPNSSLQYDLVCSLATGIKLDTPVNMHVYETFLILDSENSAGKVLKKLPAARKFLNGDDHYKYQLQSLSTRRSSSYESNNTTVKVFFGIALAVLFLALFNYINLTTARAVVRAKEVGVRKALGVSRLSLLGQFFSESMLITLLAFLLAVILTLTSRALFTRILGFDMDVSILSNIYFLTSVMLVFVVTALLAGIYPAFILSNFSPTKVLRGNLLFSNKGLLARRVFIILQFTISTSLILGSAVVKTQVTFMRNKNPGFNKEQLVNISIGGRLSRKSRIIKQELKNRYGFENVSTSRNPILLFSTGIHYYNPIKKEQNYMLINSVDEDFIDNLGMKMLVPINRNMPTVDGYYYVVNETAIRELGFTKENAVGKDLFSYENTPMGKIAGVMKNFDHAGPKFKTGVFMLQVHNGNELRDVMSSLQVRLSPQDNKQEKIALLEKIYRTYETERPFEYSFADEDFNSMFEEELRVSKLITVFMGLAVLIACLGLFGLVTFMTQTRMKEIGIRKVLGANVLTIVGLLSFDFVRLVLIAIVIGLGLSYYAADQWLQAFTYRAEISWAIYFGVGLFSILVALLTVSLQTLKAAVQNPVSSLKIE